MPKCSNFATLSKQYQAARKSGKSLKGTAIAKAYMSCIKGKSMKKMSRSSSKKMSRRSSKKSATRKARTM